jgi:hypothetical protein
MEKDALDQADRHGRYVYLAVVGGTLAAPPLHPERRRRSRPLRPCTAIYPRKLPYGAAALSSLGLRRRLSPLQLPLEAPPASPPTHREELKDLALIAPGRSRIHHRVPTGLPS